VLKGEFSVQELLARRSQDRNPAPVDNFGREFIIGDFDVSADGREIVFDRLKENADIVLIEQAAR